MGVLTANAWSKLLRQCIDDARRRGIGFFGTDISASLRAKIDRDFDDWIKTHAIDPKQ